METTLLTSLLFILILAVFLGLELAAKTPGLLSAPVSGPNTISGITVLGAILAAGLAKGVGNNDFAALLGGVAVALAMINIVAGFVAKDKLLDSFGKKDKK